MCCESSLMFCFGSDRPPPVVAAHSVRALSLGRVLKSCAYASSVCMTVRTKRRAHHLNIVTQPIFSSSIHPYQCRIFIFYFDFFLRIPETLKEFRTFVAVLLFNSFLFVFLDIVCMPHLYFICWNVFNLRLDHGWGGALSRWWYIIRIHLAVDLCALPLCLKHTYYVVHV